MDSDEEETEEQFYGPNEIDPAYIQGFLDEAHMLNIRVLHARFRLQNANHVLRETRFNLAFHRTTHPNDRTSDEYLYLERLVNHAWAAANAADRNYWVLQHQYEALSNRIYQEFGIRV